MCSNVTRAFGVFSQKKMEEGKVEYNGKRSGKLKGNYEV